MRLEDIALSRRALLLALAGAGLVPLAGCGDPDRGEQSGDGERQLPPADAPVAGSLAGMSAFGHQLMAATAATGQNWIASPLSLAVAFAMARAGAGGQTARELDATFGYPSRGRDGSFNAITRELVTAQLPPKPDTTPRKPEDKPKPAVLTIGNALFAQNDVPIGTEFLRVLKTQYGAGVRPVDFAAPEALARINEWADRQTAGRIKKVFEQLDADTRLVLANAVYFKADWRSPILGRAATPFTRTDGHTVSPETMVDVRALRYAEVDGVRAVELPYAGGRHAMWVLLPSPGRPPVDCLSPAMLTKMRSAFAQKVVDLRLPKWEFATSLDLAKQLPPLGLVAPFAPGADFNGIAAGLFITQAVHLANISVDEWGTEAAAITALALAESGPPPFEVAFHADRPYAFAIVGGSDQIPLFIGQVSDPTAR